MLCFTVGLDMRHGIAIGDQGIREVNTRGPISERDIETSPDDSSGTQLILRASVLKSPLRIVQEKEPSDRQVLLFLDYERIDSVEINFTPQRLLGNRLIILKPFEAIDLEGQYRGIISCTLRITHNGDHILFEQFHENQRVDLFDVGGRIEHKTVSI